MRILFILPFLLAVTNAQYYPFPGYGSSFDEDYAASLGNAPVGFYDKKHYGGPNGPYGGPYGSGSGNSEVAGASLGGAKVGLYGKDHQQGRGPVVYPMSSVPYPPVPYSYPRPAVPYTYPRPPMPYRRPKPPAMPRPYIRPGY